MRIAEIGVPSVVAGEEDFHINIPVMTDDGGQYELRAQCLLGAVFFDEGYADNDPFFAAVDPDGDALEWVRSSVRRALREHLACLTAAQRWNRERDPDRLFHRLKR